MTDASAARTDHGTVIGPDHAALVVGPDGELRLLLPDQDDNASLPIMMMLLAAVAIRSGDRGWVLDTLSILDE